MTAKLLAVAALLAACAPAPSPRAGSGGGTAPAPASPAAPGGQVQQAVSLIIRHRARVRCPALIWDSRAAAAAQAHSDDMERRDFFSHTSPEGRGPVQRLQAQGVTSFAYVAENIAKTGGGPQDVVSLWLKSPQHRANIENCQYTHHGLALRRDYWTHVFFTPRG